MKKQNYYEILGLPATAAQKEIKKQYMILAIKWHPDKHGNNSKEDQEIAAERFKDISCAHDTLVDPEKRAAYDEKLKISTITLDEEDVVDATLSRIKSYKKPFSGKFKIFHANYVTKYQQKNLEKEDISSLLQFFYYDVYKDKVKGEVFPNIFILVKFKKNHPYIPLEFKSKLTPQAAFTLFLGFLKGHYYGKSLHQLIGLFDDAIESTKDTDERNLYDGIKEILVFGVINLNLDESLIQAIQKITDYAKKYATHTDAMSFMAPVLQSKYFRQLFSFAMHLYWMSDVDVTDNERLTMFNGEQRARKLFEEFKEKLFDSDKKHEHLIRFIRTLYKFEKIIHEFKPSPNQTLAEFYREKAYLILDWYQALAGHVKPNIIANTILQAGIYFQKASRQLQKPELQMADEAMALQCYLLAHELAQHTTPDVTLYIHIQSLKYILRFAYAHDELTKIIHAIQNKTLLIANIFPFFQATQSNIEFFIQEDQMLVLMRQLLHALTNMMTYNEKSSQKLELDHEYITILYQAYEACLKNWYDEKYNPEVEKKFRLKLMLELLNFNRWTFAHIKANLTKPTYLASNVALPWVTVKRDDQGWIRPDRHLALPSDPQIKFYRGLKGIEINRRTGEINFVFEPASTSNNSYTEQLISLFDIHEILATKATAAAFSLDPPDPDRPYHPFNKMWFAPSKLYGSQLLHTMFLADYLLKFLTVGWEVQADDPFDMQSVNELIKKLPPHLKKIILDFRATKKNRGDDTVHRFWIQAEEMSYEENDEKEQQEKDIRKIAFDTVRMIVCKHRMIRDRNGKLIDKEEKGEGWNMYVLKPDELKQNIDRIEGPAMIWVDKTTVCFFEDGQSSRPYAVKNYGQHLAKLFNLKRDEYNKIIANDIAIETIYRVTKEVAKQTGVDHNFSPEYIFAREFTLHYNEFAIHFPELARLRELSRAVMIVRVLENQRLQNLHVIKQMQKRIEERDDAFWNVNIQKITKNVSNNVNQNFSNWRSHFSQELIRKNQVEQVNSFKEQIDGWNLLDKISVIRQKFENEVRSQGIYDFNRQDVRDAWSSQYNQIQSITNKKKNNYLEQFREIFKESFNNYSYSDVTDILNKFLNGESEPFLNVLINHDIITAKQGMQKAYPSHSVDDLWNALNGSAYALDRIISIEVRAEKEDVKKQLRAIIDECNHVNNTLQTLGLGDCPCDIIFIPSPLKLEALKQLPIKSKAAYVRSNKALHYVDITRNQCIEIFLDDEKMREFDAKFQLNQNKSRTLTDEELEEITSITGHAHDKLDLKPICLWVPASIHHEVEKGYSYTVYGGVQIAGNLNRLNSGQGLLSQQVFSQNNATIPGSTQLAHNKRVGDAFRDHIASFFESKGYQVDKEVHFSTGLGGRRADIQVSKNGDIKGLIECKTGNARYSAKQQAKDEWIRKEFGFITNVVRNN